MMKEVEADGVRRSGNSPVPRTGEPSFSFSLISSILEQEQFLDYSASLTSLLKFSASKNPDLIGRWLTMQSGTLPPLFSTSSG